MSGMYPDDQIVEMFGESVMYPGLDPDTRKFTDGDFVDPLKKPSYIPAATFNLILDNLESFVSGLGLIPNNTDKDQLLKAIQNKYLNLDKQFYIGKLYEQKPNDPDPYELVETGVFPEGSVWEVWSHRAELYELVPEASFPLGVTEYVTGSSVPANAYRIYQLTGDDMQIWKVNKALTNLPAQINPLDWDKLPDVTCVPRRKLQSDWNDDDIWIFNLYAVPICDW